MKTVTPAATTMTIRHQPLPKLSMVAGAQKRTARGTVVTLRRKKSHARRRA